MGCCKSKKLEINNVKQIKFKLKNFFSFVETGKTKDSTVINQKWKDHACYYSHLVIMLKWIIKNKHLSSSLNENKLNLITSKLAESMNDFDEYDLISLENKIKFMLNKNVVQSK